MDGSDVGIVAPGEESTELICQEGKLDVGDIFMQDGLTGEQDDILAECVSGMAELDERAAELFRKDFYLSKLLDLPDVDDFEQLDVKKEP